MSESVITQCPHCSTSFRVNDAQLGAANGAVRCGTCLKVFNALQHQVGGAPRANAPSAAEAKPAAAPPPAPSVAAATSAAPPAARPRDETLWIHDDLDLDSLNLDEELAKLDEFELNQEFSSIEKAPRPAESLLARRDDERDPHDERWAEALIADAEPAQPARGNPRQEPSLGEPLAEERVSFVPLRRAEDPPELRLSLDDDDDDEPSLGKRRHGLSALDEDDEESAEEQSVAPLGSARKPDEAPVESLDQLRDEPLQLAWEKPRRQWPRRLGWLLLILLALGGLAAQYVAYHFDELARQDAYRPWFAQFCPEIGCTLPSKVDVEQIRSSNLVVRSHPEFSGALVVDAIIYNRASFSQPFPLLELRFADLNGHLIANRRFKPGEYLGGELAGRTEMPPQVPIHVSLDILDPGPKAVNYSLSFHSPE
ncbi:DUF3426 domain-containing protein [Pseudomonas aeruginosa]|uniref:DUF3426 domain-containing protein n=1 Tax=Pseudomonas aeruginosa TaxID=287 RepID=UPI00053EC7C0|nr:DUF3426 domain-containing protein [Pseudomonas aeruginosa]